MSFIMSNSCLGVAIFLQGNSHRYVAPDPVHKPTLVDMQVTLIKLTELLKGGGRHVGNVQRKLGY